MNDGCGVLVERDPSPIKLEEAGLCYGCPCATDPVSVQNRRYPRLETTCLLSGRAELTREDGQTVVIQAGDLVTFMPGTRCRWDITEQIERHYRVG